MAKIRAFHAYLPRPDWLAEATRNTGMKDGLEALQQLLEPCKSETFDEHTANRSISNLMTCLNQGHYEMTSWASLFIYEQESSAGHQFGVWTATSLDDLKEGKILTHEDTLEDPLRNLISYRSAVALEGQPVVLTYGRDAEISALIERLTCGKPLLNFEYEGAKHRLWKVSDPKHLQAFQAAFTKIPRSYVADGHHRLAAAASLHVKEPQWISSLYISTGQLRCKAFHKIIKGVEAARRQDLPAFLSGQFYRSAIPGNQYYSPDQRHRLGMYLEGTWYQLNLKPGLSFLQGQSDVRILQDQVLEPYFKITDPASSPILQSWPSDRFREMLEDVDPAQDVVFTLAPMQPQELVGIAAAGISLPPKSTYTEPRMPYGLVIRDQNFKTKFQTEQQHA